MRAEDMAVVLSTKGEVSFAAPDYARDKIVALADLPREPVLAVDIRLVQEPDPARERPSAAEAVLDINGSPVRGHVAAPTMTEAIDVLVDRLKRRIERYEEKLHRLDKRRWSGEPGEHEWRHGDLPTQRPDWFERPRDERDVVKRKSFAVASQTIDEAAVDLDALGHDFFLFVDADTGNDALIAYGEDADGDASELVVQAAGEAPDVSTTVVPVVLDPTEPPELNQTEAIEVLEASGGRRLFFRQRSTGRGAVIYRRYDGHYGLIEPPV